MASGASRRALFARLASAARCASSASAIASISGSAPAFALCARAPVPATGAPRVFSAPSSNVGFFSLGAQGAAAGMTTTSTPCRGGHDDRSRGGLDRSADADFELAPPVTAPLDPPVAQIKGRARQRQERHVVGPVPRHDHRRCRRSRPTDQSSWKHRMTARIRAASSRIRYGLVT